MAEYDVKFFQEGSDGIMVEKTVSPVAGQYIRFNSSTKVPECAVPSASPSSYIEIPASALRAATTNGAAYGQVQISAGQPEVVSFDFDAATEEYVLFALPYKSGWSSGVKFRVTWSHAATTTNFGVAWKLQAQAISDDDALGNSFANGVSVTDTGGTTNDKYLTGYSSALTIEGSPTTDDMVFFRLCREVANASDTMAIDARLMYLEIDAA